MEVAVLLRSLSVELGLELIAGKSGLDRRITAPEIQKPGLALTGFISMVKPGLVQILGKTEIDYLWSLTPKERLTAANWLTKCQPPAIIVTRNLDLPEQLVKSASETRVPLITTGLSSTLLLESLQKFLANRMAKQRSIHGVMVDVFGVGILLVGKSGIGKSESALELIMRGHRLVADDVVDINFVPPSTVVAAGNELIRHNMEIRGLGIINIKDLFGVAAIRETKRIQLVIYIEEWDKNKTYDRLGIVTQTHNLLGVTIPKIDVPVRPGRSLTTIIEVAARNQILKVMGHHSALEFQSKIDASVDRMSAASGARLSRLPHSLPPDLIDGSSD
ncbi:MAG: HPr(Ser) kinase/phosphatase [Deltaproteobacteria bacterium]|nr:HPr(Ser) kinase/phosphatase [Deltaproteobacteria bacterium]